MSLCFFVPVSLFCFVFLSEHNITNSYMDAGSEVQGLYAYGRDGNVSSISSPFA